MTVETSNYIMDWDSAAKRLRVLNIKSGVIKFCNEAFIYAQTEATPLGEFLTSPRRADKLAGLLFAGCAEGSSE